MTRRRWVPVLVAVAALIVVGIAAQGTGVQWREGEPAFQMEGTQPPPAFEPPSEEEPSETVAFEEVDRGSGLPGWVSWLVLGILVGVPALLLLIYLTRRLVWWLIESQDTARRPEPDAQYLRRDTALVEQAVEAGLTEIDLGADPRSAIIACWVHFERAAEAVGIERESSDTPADLVHKLLIRHELDGAVLKRLSAAYLLARYSPHEVGEADRDRARSALMALRSQLGVPGAR